MSIRLRHAVTVTHLKLPVSEWSTRAVRPIRAGPMDVELTYPNGSGRVRAVILPAGPGLEMCPCSAVLSTLCMKLSHIWRAMT